MSCLREELKFLKLHPTQIFEVGDKVWIRNPKTKGVHHTLDRLWQGPCEVTDIKSHDRYVTQTPTMEPQVLDGVRLKKYIGNHDGTAIPVHYKCCVEGMVEDDRYVLEGISKHKYVGSGSKRHPMWLVKYKGFDEEEWQPMSSFMNNINSDWVAYNKFHKINCNIYCIGFWGPLWGEQMASICSLNCARE